MGWETNDFLLPHDSKLSVSSGATGRIRTAPQGSGEAGDGARLGRGPWTGFKVQGRTGTGTGCSRDTGVWPGSADGLDEPQPEVYVQVPAGAREHRASPAPLGVLGGCQDAGGRCPRHRDCDSRTLPDWLSPSACSQCCPGSRPRSSPSPCLAAPGSGSAIRGWRQPDAPVTGGGRPAVLALCKHCRDGAGGGCSRIRQPRNLLARQIHHRTSADTSAPGAPCPGPVLMATGCHVRGGNTTPQSTVWSQRLCLSPFPAADPDQQHDNHNTVQLWGSWACPRASGLTA